MPGLMSIISPLNVSAISPSSVISLFEAKDLLYADLTATPRSIADKKATELKA